MGRYQVTVVKQGDRKGSVYVNLEKRFPRRRPQRVTDQVLLASM